VAKVALKIYNNVLVLVAGIMVLLTLTAYSSTTVPPMPRNTNRKSYLAYQVQPLLCQTRNVGIAFVGTRY